MLQLPQHAVRRGWMAARHDLSADANDSPWPLRLRAHVGHLPCASSGGPTDEENMEGAANQQHTRDSGGRDARARIPRAAADAKQLVDPALALRSSRSLYTDTRPLRNTAQAPALNMLQGPPHASTSHDNVPPQLGDWPGSAAPTTQLHTGRARPLANARLGRSAHSKHHAQGAGQASSVAAFSPTDAMGRDQAAPHTNNARSGVLTACTDKWSAIFCAANSTAWLSALLDEAPSNASSQA